MGGCHRQKATITTAKRKEFTQHNQERVRVADEREARRLEANKRGRMWEGERRASLVAKERESATAEQAVRMTRR